MIIINQGTSTIANPQRASTPGEDVIPEAHRMLSAPERCLTEKRLRGAEQCQLPLLMAGDRETSWLKRWFVKQEIS